MSPRRSSRARTSQPASKTAQQSASTSSASSLRPERNPLPDGGLDGTITSPTPRPLSVESDSRRDVELGARQPRIRKQANSARMSLDADMDQDNLNEDEDVDDVTRCICGHSEYPGPPAPLNSDDSEDMPEDAGSLFIQCDKCHVWQHGGCVGIMTEAMSPDEYYCELCAKQLHKVMAMEKGGKRQRYSRYLPVYDDGSKPPRKPSFGHESAGRSSKEADEKARWSNAVMSSAKRRSTMNSRAALDEEEALRKAIEESKSDGSAIASGNGIRKAKRGRDDSDDNKTDLKRRKTGAESDTPSRVNSNSLDPGSDPEARISRGKASGGSHKHVRGPVVQEDQERQLRGREVVKEKERVEAAGRRKGRAERRRAEESESLEDSNRTATAQEVSIPKSRATAASKAVPVGSQNTASAPSHKRNHRPLGRRSRVGRNQYTRDRDVGQDSSHGSPRPPQSRDSDTAGHGRVDGHSNGLLTNGSKPSKPKVMNPTRTSMNDLRKRAAGILEFISRTQIDMASETLAGNSPDAEGTKAILPSNAPAADGGGREGEGEGEGEEAHTGRPAAETDAVGFARLSSLRMMDVLSRKLVHWQRDYGKYGDK